MFSEKQIKVLELLLEKYENSKTYLGENRVTQNFDIAPTKVFEMYHSDYADMDYIRDFESQMSELESKGLISIKRNQGVIKKLEANPVMWKEYYDILQRKDKLTLEKLQVELYENYLGQEVLERFCQEQVEQLNLHKKPVYEIKDAESILKLCKFILNNHEDILERELSIALLGDSKLWEKKYRSKVCRLLQKYGKFDDLLLGVTDREYKEDKREMERIILAEHNVYSNPSYVYFKGNAEFFFDDGQRIKVSLYTPMAFSTETLKHLESIHIEDEKVMTIENLTSFNRLEEKNAFLIFLSGYHNSVKQRLIRKIYDMNSVSEYNHFGDIDPDGFYIIENLRRGTGIDFKPVYMNVDILKKYEKFAKQLTDNDIQKGNALVQNGMYSDIMRYMLNTGLKLEQEIVSWMER